MRQIAWGDRLVKIFRSAGAAGWVVRILYIFSAIFFLLSLLEFYSDVRTTEVATAERLERQYDYKLEEIAKLEEQGKGEEWSLKLLDSMNADLAEIGRGRDEMAKLARLSQKKLTAEVAEYYLMVSALLFFAGYFLGREVRNS